MPSADLFWPFLIATSLFAFMPGPGMVYMAVQTMAHGVRAGGLSSVAFHLASYVHIASAALGVTILLAAAPVLLLALKLAGAGYLIWMGARMLLVRPGSARPAPGVSKRSARRAFRDSLVVEFLNPKSALFYLAFLPQFTSADAGAAVWLQILVLGAIANTLFSTADIVCILAARLVAARASASTRLSAWGRRLGGSILIAMGAKLAVFKPPV
ncbi:MAG: LysE family translocator [Pseudomonadota bacterium]